jgi:hypothetical protein
MSENTFYQISLTESASQTFLRNLVACLGFDYSGPDTLEGQSGLKHQFVAIGTKRSSILLVAGGVEKIQRKHMMLDPREQMELWRDSALLSAYDVQNVLLQEGKIIDLLFFHNANYQVQFPPYDIHKPLSDRLSLGRDFTLFGRDHKLLTQTMSSQELAYVAEAVGASFLSLDDITLPEIDQLVSGFDDSTVDLARNLAKRLRLAQYFEPPTDELILTAFALSKTQDKSIVRRVYDTSLALGHVPAANALVPSVDFRDPVQTAKELEHNKYISFESRIEVTQQGQRIVQTIRKSAQGSFVVRVLRALGLADLAKSILKVLK